jgi:DNA-binding transcriptional LysR family regulator
MFRASPEAWARTPSHGLVGTTKLLMQLDIAVTGARRIAKGTIHDFRIGTASCTSGLLIADAARELHERHPELAIDFVEISLPQLK